MNRKSMMKSTVVFGIICAALVFGGCASTYYGQYDGSVPIKEQCLLEIDSGITVFEFDGKKVNWEGVRSIPAGTHSLAYYRRYGRTGDETLDFKPRYTYTLNADVFGEIRIWQSTGETREPGSLITVPEHQFLGLGITAKSPGTGVGAVWAWQHGVAIDSDIVTTGLYWDFGFGFGNPVDDDINPFFITYTGISSEFYLPGKSFGLGVGAGIISPDVFLFDFSPYLRATVIPFKRIVNLKLYFEYYLPVVQYVTIKDEHGEEYSRNDWGMGLTWFW
jgi:hypothetical protein